MNPAHACAPPGASAPTDGSAPGRTAAPAPRASAGDGGPSAHTRARPRTAALRLLARPLRRAQRRPDWSCRSAPRTGSSATALRVAREAAFVVGGLLAYSSARGFAGEDPARALRHAHDLTALEHRLGVDVEPQLQAVVLPHDHVMDALNWVYIWGFWPLITVVLLWLVIAHPPQFHVVRNTLLLTGLAALSVYVLYPVTPPRLAGLGLFDSVTERSHAYRVLQPPALVDQYAAMPSMHMGWNLLLAITVFRYARHRAVRLGALLLPPLMLSAIVLTANHWLLDAVAGALIALAGLLVVERSVRRGARVVPRVPAGCVPLPRRGT